MKNKYWIIIALIVIAIVAAIFFYNNTNKKNSNYEATRTESNVNTSNSQSSNNTSISNNSNNITSEATNTTHNETQITQNLTGKEKEEEIATFTTKIVSKDNSRQKNIAITCSTLNDTLVKNGETFSFCNTVGQATTAKGYEEADIFDANGNKKKGLGGGNCQVSTTLYNAVLATPSLVVTERHAHSNKVPYIQNGKDAAVAFGSYDLKFRNDSGKLIKIKASSTATDVTIKLMQLS